MSELEKVARELENLLSRYTISQENALRVVSLLYQDIYRIAQQLKEIDRGGPVVKETSSDDF